LTLSVAITDQMLRETSGLLGGLTETLWEGETDFQPARDEALRQVKNDLTQAGLDPDDIDDDDTSLKYALIYKTLQVIYEGLMRSPGDAWDDRAGKAERRYSSEFRSAIITLSSSSTTTVSGRASR